MDEGLFRDSAEVESQEQLDGNEFCFRDGCVETDVTFKGKGRLRVALRARAYIPIVLTTRRPTGRT